MDHRQRAEEHLRTIRNLMERATVYRAISAPTALVGGLLATLVAVVTWLESQENAGLKVFSALGTWNARTFIGIWLCVLVLTLFANTWFIWRKARREGGLLLTPGLKWAIVSATPVVLITGILTSLFWKNDETTEALPILAITWIVCYGLALLATSSFAPRSLLILGWIFLFSGIIALICIRWFNAETTVRTNGAMGLTFGLYHLIYAALTWPRKARHE
jgi:hypothetical protein